MLKNSVISTGAKRSKRSGETLCLGLQSLNHRGHRD
jgi:hypothetical protein